MASRLLDASQVTTNDLSSLGLAMMRCFSVKGTQSFIRFLNRRGEKPLRSFLVRTMEREFGDLGPDAKRAGRDSIANFFQEDMPQGQWQELFVSTGADKCAGFSRKIARATMAAVVAICNEDLPVQSRVIQALKEGKELTRNVSFTVVTALAELVWKHATPLCMAVHNNLVAQCVMLLCLALLRRFGDEVSLRVQRASVRDLAIDVQQYCSR